LKEGKKSLPELSNITFTGFLLEDMKKIVKLVKKKNEGGYFHPLNYVTFPSSGNPTSNPGIGVSSETLWGEDRKFKTDPNQEVTRLKTKFWDIVDRWSGFGPLKTYNDTKNKRSEFWFTGDTSFPIKKLEEFKNKGWKRDALKDFPNMSNNEYLPNKSLTPPNKKALIITELQKALDLTYDIAALKIQDNINTYFKEAKYKEFRDMIYRDPNLMYLWTRARYNGPDFFKKYATNIKKIWDNGERDKKKLICEDLKYRWEYNKNKTYKNDILKTIDYFRYWYV
jgi:hypothetical protein